MAETLQSPQRKPADPADDSIAAGIADETAAYDKAIAADQDDHEQDKA